MVATRMVPEPMKSRTSQPSPARSRSYALRILPHEQDGLDRGERLVEVQLARPVVPLGRWRQYLHDQSGCLAEALSLLTGDKDVGLAPCIVRFRQPDSAEISAA